MKIQRPSPSTLVRRTVHHLAALNTKRARALVLLGLIALATTTLASSVSSAGSFRQLILGLGSTNAGGSQPSQPEATLRSPLLTAASLQSSTALAAERRGHTATLLADGRVLIVGGENIGGLIGQSEIFDPTAGSFSVGGNLGAARADHSATRLVDGRVLIAGGRGAAGALTTTEIFDPTTGAFASGPAMSVARAGHSATLFADGRVLFAGGEATGSAEVLDPAAGSSTTVGSLNNTRSAHSAALLQDGRVLIIGGRDASGNELSSGEIFDTPAASFSAVAGSLKLARVRAHLRVLFDGKVQIIGGNNDRSMEIYDPLFESFGAYAHLIPESDTCAGLPAQVLASQTRAGLFYNGQTGPLLDRSGHTITELSGLSALVAGGGNSSGSVLNSFSVLTSSNASISTDKMDYGPGETVAISGRGFQSGETVRLKIHEDPHTPQERGFDAVANADGNFAGEYLVQDYDLNMKFIVGARGLSSGWTAQTTFTDAFKADLEGQSAVSTVNQTGTGVWIAGNLQNWQEQSLIPMRVHMTGGPIANQPITVEFDHTKTQGGSITPGIQNLTNFATSAGVTMTTPVLSAPAGQDSWSYTFSVTLSGSTGDVNFNGIMAVGANNFSGSSLALSGTPALGTLQISKPAPIGTADLSITKTGPSTANPSQTVTYTLSYLNKVTSPNIAGNTQITDTVPAGLSYVPSSCTGGCSFDSLSKTLTWNLGALAIGASGSVTFQATVTAAAGTTVINTGLIQSSAADPNLTDNDSSVSTNITLACTTPNVTTQPTNQIVTYGAASASFTAAAGGSPTPTVQWQVQIGGVGSFTSLSNGAPYSGVNTGTLTITNPTVALSTNQYRAVFTNSCGGTQTANSNAATLTVNAKAVTLTGTRTYDGTTDAAAAILTVSNAVGTDTVNVASGTGTLASKDVGARAITAFGSLALGGTDAGNYTLTGATGSVTITARAVTLTGTRAYDGTTSAAAAILTVSNAVGGDTVNVASGSGTLASKNIGARAITSFGTLTLGNNAAGNYTLTGATGSVTINALAVNLTGTRAYDGTTSASFSILTVSNKVGSEDVTVASGSGTLASKDVGARAITSFGSLALGGTDAGNYTLTGATGSVTITARAVTLTGTRAYDGTTSASFSILTVSNKVGSEDVTVASGSGTLASKDVGARAITSFGSLALGGTDAGNYTLTGATGSVTINALAVNLTGTRAYDGTTSASFSILTVSNKVGSEDVTVASGSGTLASKDVGARAITSFGSLSLGGTDAGNYTLTGASGSVTITKALLSITADSDTSTVAVDAFSKTYDGQVYSGFTARYSGFVNSETTAALSGTLSFSGAGTTATAAGGPYTVTPGGQTSSNYDLSFVNGTLNINRAPLSITADSDTSTVAVDAFSKTYDGQVYSGFTARYSGFVNSETTAALSGTLSFSGAGTTATAAGGPYTVTPGGQTSSNYDLSFVPGSLNITKATLTVTANNQTTQYSDPVSLTATITGFVNGDTPATAYTGAPAVALNPVIASFNSPQGTYPNAIKPTIGTLESTNYGFQFVCGTLTITLENAVVTPAASNPGIVAVASNGTSPTFTLSANIKEGDPITELPDPNPGDTTKAVPVTFVLKNVAENKTYTCNTAVTSGGGVSQTLNATCQFSGVQVDVYTVTITVGGTGTYYIGSDVSTLVVADPSLGFTTGGGWLRLTDGTRVNYGFNAKTLKSGQVQGSLLAIFRRTDGNYIVKSNAMGYMAIAKPAGQTYWTATFGGKATYAVPNPQTLVCSDGTTASKCGGYEFTTYVEDRNEPGTGFDKFWIQLKKPDGVTVVGQATMPSDQLSVLTTNGVTAYPRVINGGNIQVPQPSSTR